MQNRCTVVAYIIKQAAFLCKAPPVINCHKNPASNQLVVCHPAQTRRKCRLSGKYVCDDKMTKPCTYIL